LRLIGGQLRQIVCQFRPIGRHFLPIVSHFRPNGRQELAVTDLQWFAFVIWPIAIVAIGGAAAWLGRRLIP
jgi:hypothetical protein